MEANTDMREEEEEEENKGEDERRRKAEKKERVGTTGGTYCQVGPRGVARVAPLSDSTHKREVGKTLAVGIEIGRKGKQKRRGETKKDEAGDILYFLIVKYIIRKDRKRATHKSFLYSMIIV